MPGRSRGCARKNPSSRFIRSDDLPLGRLFQFPTSCIVNWRLSPSSCGCPGFTIFLQFFVLAGDGFAIGINRMSTHPLSLNFYAIAIPPGASCQGGAAKNRRIQRITRYTTVDPALLMSFAYYVMLKDYNLLNLRPASSQALSSS